MEQDIQHGSGQKTDFTVKRPTIAYLASDLISDPTAIAIWSGIVDEAEARGFNLIGIPGGHLDDRSIAPDNKNTGKVSMVYSGQDNILYKMVTPDVVDGIVSWSAGFVSPRIEAADGTDEMLLKLYQFYRPLPIVTLSKKVPGYPTIVVDHVCGMQVIIQHLVETHNFRRIAFIRGPANHPASESRYQSYLDSLQHYNIPFNPDIVTPPADWDPKHGKEAIILFMEERGLQFDKDIEVIVAVNDAMAITAMQTLLERGIKVPEDVAIVGYNDSLLAQCAIPSVTSVNMPFNEQGRKAVETLSHLINKQTVPDEIVIHPKLVIHESCGCLEKNEEEKKRISDEVEKQISSLLEQREAILREMSVALEAATIQLNDGWEGRVFEAFLVSLKTGKTRNFLTVLREELEQEAIIPTGIFFWQNVILILQYHAFTYIEPKYLLSIFGQVRTILGDYAYRMKVYKELENERENKKLRKLSEILLSTFEINELVEVLFRGLQELSIPGVYIALYENSFSFAYPAAPPESARLILAYNEQGRFALPQEGLRFSVKELIPPELRPRNRRYTFIQVALYSRDNQIGYVLFEIGPRIWTMYLTLRSLLSSALKSTLLVKQLQEHSAELVRQKYIVDTFIETLPDRIWFKDTAGRFTRANQAHAAGLGLKNTAEELGKTDLDFFDEEGAHQRALEEMEIIKTGKPLLYKEMSGIWPDGSQRWSLVTKMPLLNEHHEIVGTFGISRDITDLKLAQEALKQANQEISKLNEELKKDNMRMYTEMEVARHIQTALLPETVVNLHPDFEIAALMQPATEVGGDYYDATVTPNGQLWLGIGDVSGHGVTPGLIMMMAQTIHAAIATHYEVSAQEMVAMVNRILFRNVNRRLGENHYMTFTTLKYLGYGRFQHAGAHLPIIVYRQHNKICEMIATTGTFLNLLPDITEQTRNAELLLDPGDIMLLYTDGLIEACNNENKLLGTDRLAELVRKHATKRIDALKNAIILDIMSFCQGKLVDDMSLVVVRRIH